MNNGRSDTALVLLVFLAAWAGVNVPVLGSPLGHYPVVDARWHMLWAEAVSNGNLFIYAPFFRAPLYPWLLGGWFALFGPGVVSGALLSMAAGAATTVLLHRTGLAFTSRGAAFLVAASWAVWGTALLYQGFMLIEPLYVLLLCATFSALCRRPDSPAPWFLLGLSCVARPGAVLLLPVSILLFRPRVRSWTAWFIPVLSIWAVNMISGDPGTVISSQGGINFYVGSGPDADGVTAFAPTGHREPSGELPYVDNVWAASLAPLPDGTSPSGVSSYWTRLTLGHISSHPVGSLTLLCRKALFLVSPVEIPCNYDAYYMGRISPLAGVLVTGPPFAFPGLILWLLLPGALLAGRAGEFEKRAMAWALTLAVGLAPFFITARFRLPLIPFMLLFMVPRFLRVWKRGLLMAPLGAAIGVGLAVLTGPAVETSGVNMPFHDGMANYSSGNRREARSLFMQAWERASARIDGVDLNGTDALYNLGVMDLEDGDRAGAVFWFGKALEWNPAHAPSREALRNLTPEWQ
jgi:hypothetical protein